MQISTDKTSSFKLVKIINSKKLQASDKNLKRFQTKLRSTITKTLLSQIATIFNGGSSRGFGGRCRRTFRRGACAGSLWSCSRNGRMTRGCVSSSCLCMRIPCYRLIAMLLILGHSIRRDDNIAAAVGNDSNGIDAGRGFENFWRYGRKSLGFHCACYGRISNYGSCGRISERSRRWRCQFSSSSYCRNGHWLVRIWSWRLKSWWRRFCHWWRR